MSLWRFAGLSSSHQLLPLLYTCYYHTTTEHINYTHTRVLGFTCGAYILQGRRPKFSFEALREAPALYTLHRVEQALEHTAAAAAAADDQLIATRTPRSSAATTESLRELAPAVFFFLSLGSRLFIGACISYRGSVQRFCSGDRERETLDDDDFCYRD